MLTALRASEPALADRLAVINAMPTEEMRLAAFDGTLLKGLFTWLIAMYKANPEQATALVNWILALLGLPPIVIPVPPVPVNDGPSIG